MKKVLAVVAVVCVVCMAGAAIAQPKAKDNNARRLPPQQMQQAQPRQQAQPQPGPMGPQFNGAPCFCGRNDDRGRGFEQRRDDRGYGRGMMFAPDMPDEIRAKAVEVAKLRIDLDAALSERPIDKAKALDVFAKIQKAEQELEAWRFGKRIEQIEAFRTQQELNRRMPPAPPAPAPKPEAPAPAPEAPAE